VKFRGVCVDPGWGPIGSVGSPDPVTLARLGVYRVRLISKPGIEWYIERCWENGILVRAVVTTGYYCPADEYLVLNEPNLNGISAVNFAAQLQTHRDTYPDHTLISGGLGDAPSIGIDAAAYIRDVQDAGGLTGYNGVAIHYPASSTRIAAFRRVVSSILPIHVDEYNVPAQKLPNYIDKVLAPYAQTADWFCVNDGMRDPGWQQDFGLYNPDWSSKPELRYWLSLT
jgi:hypothetical protein